MRQASAEPAIARNTGAAHARGKLLAFSMLTKALFDELKGFRTDLESAEDVDLWLRAAYGRNIAYIPYPLFFIVRTPGSVTARRMDGTYADNLRVIDDFCRENPGYPASSSRTVARARAKVWENWGSQLLGKQQLQAARRCLRKFLANRTTQRAAYLWIKAVLLQVFVLQPETRCAHA